MRRDDYADVYLNQIAQQVRTVEAGTDWLLRMADDEQESVLGVLATMIHQAHPRLEEVPIAIARSGLKPSYTPCVVLSRATTHRQVVVRAYQVADLIPAERAKAFRLLMALFQLADERRRATQCLGQCAHWWHQDLGDEAVIKRLWLDITMPRTDEQVAYWLAYGEDWLNRYPLPTHS